jgi:predicted negative regulator of RcsB-dependent stress response
MIHEAVKKLNDFGTLSSVFLMRKYKMSYDKSLTILEAIIQDYDNVYYKMNGMICIKGREYPACRKKYKRSKFKDITQA